MKKTSRKLLDLDAVDYIASDAHDLDERAGHMKECYELVRKKYGEETARRVFVLNPGRILEGTE